MEAPRHDAPSGKDLSEVAVGILPEEWKQNLEASPWLRMFQNAGVVPMMSIQCVTILNEQTLFKKLFNSMI